MYHKAIEYKTHDTWTSSCHYSNLKTRKMLLYGTRDAWVLAMGTKLKVISDLGIPRRSPAHNLQIAYACQWDTTLQHDREQMSVS